EDYADDPGFRRDWHDGREVNPGRPKGAGIHGGKVRWGRIFYRHKKKHGEKGGWLWGQRSACRGFREGREGVNSPHAARRRPADLRLVSGGAGRNARHPRSGTSAAGRDRKPWREYRPACDRLN